MSFLNSIKFHAKTLMDSANNAIQRMNSYPDEVMCSNNRCRKILPVPAATFMWTCTSGHVNDASEPVCSQCPCTKKAIVAARKYIPSVTCSDCGALTVVPESNLYRKMDQAIRVAPDAIESTVKRAVSDIRQLGDDADTFPCDHCTSTLSVPKGPWKCLQTECSHDNPASTSLCVKCKCSRYACGVMCGVCSRMTRVPSVKFVAAMNSSVNSVVRATDASMKQFQGTPFVYCKHCRCVLQLDQADATVLLGSTATAGDVPSSPESRGLSCKQCLQSATYTGADIAVQKPEAVLETPNSGADRPVEGICARCPSSAWRRCQSCDLCFCNTHAPFIRRVPSDIYAPHRPICRACVITYDETYMKMPVAPANAPVQDDVVPLPPNAVPEVAEEIKSTPAPAPAPAPAPTPAPAPATPTPTDAVARKAALTGAGAAATANIDDSFEDSEKFTIDDESAEASAPSI